MSSSASDDSDVYTGIIDVFEESSFELESDVPDKDPPSLCKFKLLDRDEIIFYMADEIDKVKNILMIADQPIVRCLLNHYKWNAVQLLNDYFNSENIDTFIQSIGINSTVCEGFALTLDPTADCKICFTPFSETQETFLMCGHQFCMVCMGQYLKAKVLDDGEGDRIKCPAINCSKLIADDIIMNLVADEVKQRFKMLITNTFVLCNPLLRWCRTPDCEYAFKVTKVESSSLPVLCNCGFEWCFQCGELCHDSITCALLKRWIQYSKEDVESDLWIQEHSKKCPKCTMNIQKNGGCNHMTCKSCRHEFCWLCMGVWCSNHSCNQFEPQKEASNIMTLRFSHYNTRYQNHTQSLKLEHGLYESIQSKMKHLQGIAGLTQNEVLFLKHAVESLRRSRQILISTYVFAYYAERSNQLLIFEDNQKDLERATESLSWILEQDITSESMTQFKQKLQEKYIYCDRRRKVLMDHMHEGYERKYWNL